MTGRHNPFAIHLLIAAALSWLSATAQAEDRRVLEIDERELHSSVLDETRRYQVLLPASYTDNRFGRQRYPVVYLLDGEVLLPTVGAVAQFMYEGGNRSWQIPELIVVGVVNVDRTRDMSPTHSLSTLTDKSSNAFASSGGGAAFLDFLASELVPEVERNFRTLPHRTVVGHSFGGLSALFALIEKPRLFQACIAIDPSLWWDDEFLVRKARAWSADSTSVSGRVFLSAAGLDVSRGPFDRVPVWDRSIADFAGILSGMAARGLSSRYRLYETEDHGSVPLPSIHDGLRHVFEGYRLNYADLYQGPDHLRAHFARASASMGFAVVPPGRMLDDYAFFLLRQLGEHDKAIGLLKLNVENYPHSTRAHESLADAFRLLGENASARQSYERALALEPGNRQIEEKIAALPAPARPSGKD